MIAVRKASVSLSYFLLLVLQVSLFGHCVVEEEPLSSPPEEEAPSTGGKRGGSRSSGGSSGASTFSDPAAGFGYVPYTRTDSLGRQLNDNYCDLTPLIVNSSEYNNRCGAHSDPKWPCFSHDGDDDLSRVTIDPWWAPLNMTNEIVLKEPDNANEFTLRNASIAFVIRYPDTSPAALRYYDYEPSTGCYKIHLSGDDHGRVHVSTTDRDYRDIDTAYYKETGMRLCSKTIIIGTRNRDRSTLHMKDSDNSGI